MILRRDQPQRPFLRLDRFGRIAGAALGQGRRVEVVPAPISSTLLRQGAGPLRERKPRRRVTQVPRRGVSSDLRGVKYSFSVLEYGRW